MDVLSVSKDFGCVIPQLVYLRYVAANIENALSLAKLRNLETIILGSLETGYSEEPTGYLENDRDKTFG